MKLWIRNFFVLSRLFGKDVTSEHPAGKFLTVVRFLLLNSRHFKRKHCFLRASALTYTSILTLLPVMVLIFIVFRAFGGLTNMQADLEKFLFRHLLPDSVGSIQSTIHSLVSGFNSSAVSIVSFLFLFFSAYGLLASIDFSMNAIWSSQTRRSFFSRLLNLWLILSIAPLLMGYSIYLSSRVIRYQFLQSHSLHLASQLLQWIFPVVITWIALTVVYRNVPRRPVRWGPAMAGGFIAAILWEISKWGFNIYVQNMTNLELLYGSFLMLPVFLIWLNVTWLVFLLGAVFSYGIQNYQRMLKEVQDSQKRETVLTLSPGRLAVYLMHEIARGFEEGSPRERNQLGESLDMDYSVLDEYLDIFNEAGLILKVENRDQYIPGKAVNLISLNEVMDLFETDHPAPEGLRETYSELTEARRSYIREKTFRDYLDVKSFQLELPGLFDDGEKTK